MVTQKLHIQASFSGFTADLGPPPSHSHKQKPPVVKELRWLAFKGMTGELEHPSSYEQAAAYSQSLCTKMPARNIMAKSKIDGMPRVWQMRLIGC